MREGEKFLEEPTTIGDLTNKTKPKFCLTANKKKRRRITKTTRNFKEVIIVVTIDIII